MARTNPWQKAEECQFAAMGTIDPAEREVLTKIRNLWIALANERSFLTASEFREQIKWISDIQAELVGGATAHWRISRHRGLV